MSSRTRYSDFTLIRTRITTLASRLDLTLAVNDLDWCDPRFLTAAQRMQDARAGLPGAQAYDAPSVSGGGSELTGPERLANQTDSTEADRVLLDKLLHDLASATDPAMLILDGTEYARLITRDVLTLRRLIEAWTPRAPTDKQRNAVARANDPESECSHHRTFGTFEPVHRTTDGNGLLNLPTPLCRFCYDRLRTDGKLPSADRMQRLAQGRSDRVRA